LPKSAVVANAILVPWGRYSHASSSDVHKRLRDGSADPLWASGSANAQQAPPPGARHQTHADNHIEGARMTMKKRQIHSVRVARDQTKDL